MKANRKTFSGGYHFNFEGNPRAEVVEMEIPSTVIIPLKQGYGDEVKPLVKPGDKVKAGQVIGRDDQLVSSPVHASVSGEVEKLDSVEYPRGAVTSIVIKSDGATQWEPLAGRQKDWIRLSVPEIEELLYTSGVTSLDSQGIPTKYNSSPNSGRDVKHLIVKGVEANPYNVLLPVLMAGEGLHRFIEGLRILQKIMPQAKVHVALNSNRPELFAELNKLAQEYEWLELHSLTPKYPQGSDEVLISTILGESSVKDSLAVVLKVQTILQARDAVIEGKPSIERMVALSGPGWEDNIHLMVRVGTPLKSITDKYLKKTGLHRLVPNNLLTNLAITDLSLPVDRTFDNLNAIPENTNRALFSCLRAGAQKSSYSKSFLSAMLPMLEKTCDTNAHGEARACIFCGYCEEVCPAGIIPHLLDKYVKKNIIDEQLIRFGVFNCVECNLCSYVCPSKIHLAWNIKAGQQLLIENEFKQPVQHQKRHFSFHFFA